MDEFAQRYAEAWCSQNPESVAEFFSENGALKVNDGAPAVGRLAIAETARGFMTAFPDMIVTFDKLIPTNDGAEFYWTLIGTNTGAGGTGNCIRISGFEVWRIDADRLIAESKGYFDENEYRSQIDHDLSE